MSERRFVLMQEDAAGVFVRRTMTPTAAQHTISCDATGLPVVTAASAAQADESALSATVIAAADVVTGTGADGTTPSGAEWGAGVTMLNEIKADFNLMRADLESLRVAHNAALALLRTHNILLT